MICAYELTAAERHTIREGLYETMADFERSWRMLLHLWMQYWGEHPTDYQHWVQNDAEAIGDLLLTIVNVLGDALTSYHLMTGGEFEGDRDPCAAYLREAACVEQSRRADSAIDAVREMVCQSHTLSTAERDAFLGRLNNEIMAMRDKDIMQALEEFTAEVKDRVSSRAE